METNRDVWVLESITEMDSLSVVIPHLRHYVCFDHRQDVWQGYLTQIITSYDDSHVLKAITAGAATGAAFRKGEGALWGAGIGLFLAAMAGSQGRPQGMLISCPHCLSSYNVHLAEARMRCPVCNTRLEFPDEMKG
jgi:hypothetical protein